MSDPAPRSDDPDELLHELRLRGWVERSDDDVVRALVARGHAERRDTRVLPTPQGREAHARWARVPPGSETEQALEQGYARFLDMNARLLKLCTDWQLLPGNVPNDHSDVVYDWSVVNRLVAFDGRAGPLVRTLGDALERLDPYRPRLRHAVGRVEKGEHDWFLSPRHDSYHTVWMQLHEDLLLALGRDRIAEEQSG
jgi:hypothetical protein